MTDAKPDWENFAKAVLADWPTGDLDGSVLFELSLQYGMIQEVPGGFNSDRHFDNDGICPEEGDPWYEYTFRGEDEHYDTMMEVELDPCGAHRAIQNQHARIEELEAKVAEYEVRLRKLEGREGAKE